MKWPSTRHARREQIRNGARKCQNIQNAENVKKIPKVHKNTRLKNLNGNLIFTSMIEAQYEPFRTPIIPQTLVNQALPPKSGT